MTAAKPMTPLRRRPMPGMPAAPPASKPEPARSPDPDRADRSAASSAPETLRISRPRRRSTAATARGEGAPRRHPVDYSATHLSNFRLPVDLHARYGQLIAETQQRYPQLRKMSLTEVVIALLVEGPQTPEEVAELVRRKRLAEHSAEGSR